MTTYTLLIGALNRGPSTLPGVEPTGFAVASFDAASGEIAIGAKHDGADNPSFLATNAQMTRAYVTSEVGHWPQGLITALDLTGEAPRHMGLVPCGGNCPAYVSLDATGRFLFVSNYQFLPVASGPGLSVAVFALDEDGAIGACVSSLSLHGTGPNAARQDQTHAHCVVPTLANDAIVVADLGGDALHVVPFDAETGALGEGRAVTSAPGSGPRHVALHPNGRDAYVSNELDFTVSWLRLGEAPELAGTWETREAVATGDAPPSDLVVNPEGTMLYFALRGDDQIVRFAIRPDGSLERIGASPTGPCPRNLCLSPDGRWLLVASQDGGRIEVHAIDPATGALTLTHEHVIDRPMCLVMG